MTELIDSIKEHHTQISEELKGSLADLQSDDVPTDTLSSDLYSLSEVIRNHIIGEEEALLPEIESILNNSDNSILLALKVEETFIEEQLDRIIHIIAEKEERDEDALREAVTKLEVLIDLHCEKMNSVLLPMLDQHASEEQKKGIVEHTYSCECCK